MKLHFITKKGKETKKINSFMDIYESVENADLRGSWLEDFLLNDDPLRAEKLEEELYNDYENLEDKALVEDIRFIKDNENNKKLSACVDGQYVFLLVEKRYPDLKKACEKEDYRAVQDWLERCARYEELTILLEDNEN